MCSFVPSKDLRHKLRKKLRKDPTQTERVIFDILSATAQQKMASLIYNSSTSAITHQKIFGEYKGKFFGQEVVLVAAGPTARGYRPVKGAVHVGCNRSFMLESLALDFLFLADFRGISSFMQEFIDYKGNNCVKFIGDLKGVSGQQIPEDFFLKLNNTRKYKTDFGLGGYCGIIPVDIDFNPLWASSTIAHQAFQFILFTNPKRIYLVGCDCTGHLAGHFLKGEGDSAINKSLSRQEWDFTVSEMIKGWSKLKDFANLYYPDTEIISINPIGLKGMFNDQFITYIP